jgi:FlaA1/EpsC-like NDP-sugar epimerase
MGERLMTAAAETYRDSGTIFASTRFGNVLGSRGSVVPLFRRQIEAGGPITLTDTRMTRFIMTLSEAADLVLNSVWMVNGGEVMVTKMPVARIEDIAHVMRDELAGERPVDIVEIGSKPGEKMYEELMNDEEVRRSYELGDFFVVLSAFADINSNAFKHLKDCPKPDRPYNSQHETGMSAADVQDYFKRHQIF